jgi:hypothetical protein
MYIFHSLKHLESNLCFSCYRDRTEQNYVESKLAWPCYSSFPYSRVSRIVQNREIWIVGRQMFHKNFHPIVLDRLMSILLAHFSMGPRCLYRSLLSLQWWRIKNEAIFWYHCYFSKIKWYTIMLSTVLNLGLVLSLQFPIGYLMTTPLLNPTHD